MDEVGPSCQCGCIIHLLKSKRKRLLASSTQACSGRNEAVWTIQVREIMKIIQNGNKLPSHFFSRSKKDIKLNLLSIISYFHVPRKA